MIAGLDADQKARPAGGGEVLGAAAQHPASVERIVAAAAMPVGVLLDAAAYIVDGGEPQPHDVEGIQDPHGVRQAGRQGGAVAAERIQGGHVDAGSPSAGWLMSQSANTFRLRPGMMSMSFPRCKSTMPVANTVERPGRARGSAIVVRPDRGHLFDAVGVLDQRGAVVDNGGHHGGPADPDIAGHRSHRMPITAHPSTRLLTRTLAPRRPRPDLRMGFSSKSVARTPRGCSARSV